MTPSRRNFFRHAAAGAAVGASFPALSGHAFREWFPPASPAEASQAIILSRNENAYGPSQKVLATMRDALQFSNRYPDPAVDALHRRIAAS